MEYILTFQNTSAAIRAEQLLLAAGFTVGVMPLPGKIRAGCGICLRLREKEIGAALRVLDENNAGEAGLYTKTPSESGAVYDEVVNRRAL